MTHGTLPGFDKPISRLVLGVDHHLSPELAPAMFDAFVERGGNCFDTAFAYAGGRCEALLGDWIASRDVRAQAVILDKGGHAPFCNPEDMNRHLLVSLDRLRTDYIDIYMVHRDNPDVPAGEFIDALNRHKSAGRIRAFGGSNWTIPRIEAANGYAAKHGLEGFAAVSNNLSLARMISPLAPGCVSSSDPESRAWFERTQMPLMAWSSQSQGFFTERAHPTKRSDEELARCWYSEDNWRRRERATGLAAARGVLPTNIALAWVLCQPFPTFAIAGPRTPDELRTTFPALDISLNMNELRALDFPT
jgi:aryl-alcohol dehydrogenase-like predicted oxidoreductase